MYQSKHVIMGKCVLYLDMKKSDSDEEHMCVRVVCVTSISFYQTVKATHRAVSREAANPPLEKEGMSRADNALLSLQLLPFHPLTCLLQLQQIHKLLFSPLSTRTAGGDSIKLDLVVVRRGSQVARC